MAAAPSQISHENRIATRLEVRVQAIALAGLFAAGATLSLLTLILPHSPEASETGLLVTIGGAYLASCLLFWRASELPSWALPVALAWGTTSITAAAFFTGESPSPLILFYLWIFLYAAYLFDDRQLLIQLVYAGVAYGALLIAQPPEGTGPWWIVAMGTLLVAAMLTRSMRRRVEALIERLVETARTDALTGLANRRGFRELLDLELERARRRDSSLSVLIGDIDRLRHVNDRSGHPAGDAALRRAAALLDGGKRRIDAAARIGGGEFALILPDTDEREATVVAERLRSRVRAEFSQDTVPITISFGIATYPANGATAASLLRSADEAMRAGKQGGGDRTTVHSPALEELLALDGGDSGLEAERFTAAMLELAEAVDLRFSGTARHSETVGRYAEMMAIELGLDDFAVTRVRLAGILHDVGKALIPQAILQKPGSLDDEEFALIRQHPGFGEQILDHPSLEDVREWVGAHHERPDGRGYPRGLSGSDLPLEARIIAVADAYEAMTSDRSYRDAIGHEGARDELRRCAGTQFDTRVVKAFLRILDREYERAAAASRLD